MEYNSLDLLQYLLSKDRTPFYCQKFIKQVLASAQNNSEMVGLEGVQGMGKSTAIGEHVLPDTNSYYIRVGESFGPTNMFNELIFLVTGTSGLESTMYEKIKSLTKALTSDPNVKKLIIIDDAGKLTARALGLFHELRDNTRYCVGFVFVGLQYFRQNLLKWINKRMIGIAEFYARVNYWYEVPRLRTQEKIFYLKSRTLTDEEVKNVLKNAETIIELENEANRILRKRDNKNDI